MQADFTVLAEIKILSLYSVLNLNPEKKRTPGFLLGYQNTWFIFFPVGLLEKFFFSPCLYKLYKQAEANT